MEDEMERAMGEGVVQGGGAICCVWVELKRTAVCVFAVDSLWCLFVRQGLNATLVLSR